MEQPARQRKTDQPRQRLACDRCHALKLRCPRSVASDGSAAPADCARCLKAGSLCIYSPQARLGRPLGSQSNSSYTNMDMSGSGKRRASTHGARGEPVARPRTQSSSEASTNTNTASTNNPDLIMSASGTLGSSSSSSCSSRDPSITFNDILSDDFLSDMMQTDPEAWFNPTSLPEGLHRPSTASHDIAAGPLPSPFSSRDEFAQDIPETLDRQYQLHNHNPDHHHAHYRRSHPQQQQQQDWKHQHHQQQQLRLNPALAKHYPGVPVDKCAACSIAINPTPPVLDEEAEVVDDVLTRLSSLAVSIHSHGRHVYNQLHLLRTRLDRSLAADNGLLAHLPSANEAVTVVNDCLSIQTLITTNHTLRGVIRQIKKSHVEEEDSSSMVGLSFNDLARVSDGGKTGGSMPLHNPYTPFSSQGRIPKDPNESLKDANACPMESPNSCRLALTLALNCYLEILDIFIMTFNMISTTISHRRFKPPPTNMSAHGPNSMLDATFSIFTATQIASRLLDMVKGDMRDVWERYRCTVMATPCEQAIDAPRKATKPDPAIQMSFRLSWEKEAVLARLVEEVDHRISSMMEVS